MTAMQKRLNYLNPAFMRKIDRYLLLNFPRFWATKFHYVIFYGLIANILASLIVFISIKPEQPGDFPINSIWVVFFLVEVVVSIFWLNSQTVINVEKEYGITHYGIGIIETIVYTICIFVIFSSSLTMTITGIHRVAQICERQNLSSSFCKQALGFVGGGGSFYEFDTIMSWHLIFIASWVLSVVILKHANWRILIFAFIYLLFFLTVGTLMAIILEDSRLDFEVLGDLLRISKDNMPVWIVATFLFLFMFLISMSLIGAKKYKRFALINFVSLPIPAAFLFLLLPLTEWGDEGDLLSILIFFYIVYLLYTPIQKKLLIHVLSLPKE